MELAEQIFNEASEAAQKATNEYIAKYGDGAGTMCGFAWVDVSPARGPFVNWCKKAGKAHGDRGGNMHGRPGTYGGWTFWNPSRNYTQSVDAKEVGARAFAQVLQSYGINASVDSRLD